MVAAALAELDPEFDPLWSGDLNGLELMVLGWNLYQINEKYRLQSNERKDLGQYLEADCHALYQAMVAYAKQTKGFEQLTLADVTNPKTFTRLQDEFERRHRCRRGIRI